VNALVFTWFQPDWPIKFTWMGPDARVRAIAKIRPESVAAVIAPASIGSGSAYIHNQTIANEEWIINHNLGRRPDFSLYTVGGVQFLASIIHTSINQTIVSLGIALAGTAEGI
jgi:hypothetical protein